MCYFSAVYRGKLNTQTFRVYFKDAKKGFISPFHDIPLKRTNDTYNMVVEIPRWTNAKMEISKEDQLNPIRQDMKKGQLRYVDNVFPYHGYLWNYGALPQTYEDPNHIDNETKARGDKDPIDAIEIGSNVHLCGAVLQVKVLGLLGLLDEGETDWKIVTIDVDDPLAKELHDIEDVKRKLPHLMEDTVRWFKLYKVPKGNPPNEFAFNGEFRDKAFATQIIGETHKAWKELLDGHIKNSENISLICAADPQDVREQIVNKTSEFEGEVNIPVNSEINKVHYLVD